MQLSGGQTGRVSAAQFAEWALASINSNLKRSLLGEYIVHQALRTGSSFHEEWNAFDVSYRGLKLEVKTSGLVTPPFIPTKRPWVPQFDISRRTNGWSNELGEWTTYVVPKRCADAYIFAIHCAESKQEYDPFDLAKWKFVIASTGALDIQFDKQSTVSLSRLKRAFPYVAFDKIKYEIDKLKSE